MLENEEALLKSIEDTQQDYELFYDLDLEKLSKDNIARLQKHIQDGIEGQTPITEEVLPSGLTTEEARFVQHILTSAQFTHNTAALADIQANNNTMTSLQMRAQAGQATQNRNTKAGSKTDGYLYFTYGQTVPRFLSSKVLDQITFNPNALENHNQVVYQHGFISWYPEAAGQRRRTPFFHLGNCRFHYLHISDNEKQYVYQHDNKTPIKWTVTFQQEIFYGQDILKGLAYQMILHLRLIGGEYQRHVLKNFQNQDVVAALQDMLYPVDYYPEFKLPTQFNIAESGVKITEARSVIGEELSFIDIFRINQHNAQMQGNPFSLYFDEKDRLYENPSAAISDYQKKILLLACVENADLAQIENILSQNHFDLNEQYPTNTLLNIAIDRINDPQKRMQVVTLLIQNGADPNNAHNNDGNNAFYYAVAAKDKALFEYLLRLRSAHPRDQNIKIGPQLHKDKDRLNDQYILDLICKDNLIDWLALAIQYGANILQFPFILYATAAKNGHVQMVAELIRLGVSLNSGILTVKTPLMIFAENGNEAGLALMLKHNVDLHQRCYFRGEYLNALDFARRAKEPNENIIHSLEANKVTTTPSIPYENQKKAVVIIVTADDDNDQRYVLLGQKRNKDNTTDDKYCFPGGLVDITDQDTETAAIRELAEETNIRLNGSSLKGKFSTHTLYTFSQAYDDSYVYIEFIHFHLFVDPHSIRIKADDDLATIDWLTFDKLRVGFDKYETKRYFIKERDTYTLVEQSNGIILNSFASNTSFDKQALGKTLKIDNFSGYLLMDATKRDDVAEIEDLIHHGVNEFSFIHERDTPLNVAAANACVNAVKFYMRFNPKLLESPTHPATSAVANNHWEIFDLFNHDDLDLYNQGVILMHCIRTQNLSKTAFCLRRFKIDINQRLEGEQYFITAAAKAGHIKLVRILIHFGASVNPEFIGLDGNMTKVLSPLHAAIQKRDEEMAVFLIQQGADINCRDNITEEQVLSFSYQHLLQTMWTVEQNQKPHFSNVTKNPLDFISRNRNHNAIIKALENGCDQVIDYIFDNHLFIDLSQMDDKALEKYKYRYPQIERAQVNVLKLK